jgi:hypothetical protein
VIGARHENEPRAEYALGVHYEVLPQLVGPKLPGGVGVSGDGRRRPDQLTYNSAAALRLLRAMPQ